MFQRGIQMVGTMGKNRLQKCPILPDGNMKKKGRDAYIDANNRISGTVSCILV